MSEQIISKTCRICKQTKPISEFYKNPKTKDLHSSKCKACCAKYKIQYRKTEKGKATKIRYNKTEKGKAIRKCYKQGEKGKAAIKRYKIRHPERVKAIHVVENAIRDGRLPRPDSLPCHYCPAQAKEYHHYKGYAPEHWLDVVPVCIKCHNKIPKKQVISATA